MYRRHEHGGAGCLLEGFNIWILYYTPLEFGFFDSLPLSYATTLLPVHPQGSSSNLYHPPSGPCEKSQLSETWEVQTVGCELGICFKKKGEKPPLTRAMLKCDWMRQQVVTGPLKINVIMKALCGGLSGHGNDQQQDEEEGAASIMFHQQSPSRWRTSSSWNRRGGGGKTARRKEACNTCSRVPPNFPRFVRPLRDALYKSLWLATVAGLRAT